MATRLLGPGSLTIGDGEDQRNLAVDVTNAKLTPSNNSDDPDNFLDGHVEANTSTTWALEGTIADDFTMDGAAVWCLQHNGETLPYVFVPTTAGAVQFKGKCTIQPIAVGGDVKTKNKQDFSFACDDPVASAYTAPTPAPGA